MVTLVRREARSPDEVPWDPDASTIDTAALGEVDGAVHLAGAPIGKRWTAEHKRRILDSRVRGTTTLANALARVEPKPSVLVSASGINAYGYDRGDLELDEVSTPGDGFLAEVVQQWEAATAAASEVGIRVVNLRNGIVMSARGGALARQLPLFKLGLGGRLGSGRNWWSWISLDDEVELIVHALEHESLSGAVNATAPNPVRNAELTKELARALHRPAFLPVPAFGPRLLFGREMVKEVVMSNLRVLPAKAEASGFSFRHPDIAGALPTILGDS